MPRSTGRTGPVCDLSMTRTFWSSNRYCLHPGQPAVATQRLAGPGEPRHYVAVAGLSRLPGNAHRLAAVIEYGMPWGKVSQLPSAKVDDDEAVPGRPVGNQLNQQVPS